MYKPSFTDFDREQLKSFSIDSMRAYNKMLDVLCESDIQDEEGGYDRGHQFGLFYMKHIELGRWVVEHAIHAYHFSWLIYGKPADLHGFGLFYRSFVFGYMRRVVPKSRIWNDWSSAVRTLLSDPWWVERYANDKPGIRAVLGGSGQN